MKTFTICISSVVIFGLYLSSCQEQPSETVDLIDQLHREYELDASAERAEIFLDSLDAFVSTHIDNKEKLKPYLLKGINISKAQGMLSRTASYLLPLLRLYPDLDDKKDHLVTLGDVMYALRKRHASSVVYEELVKNHPNDNDLRGKLSLVDSVAAGQENYIGYLFDQILVSPDDYGVNRAASLKYVDAVEALALVSPQDTIVPDHLYTAAEVARSIRTFPKAMSLYDWLIDTYPSHTKTANALFIKGFILEQDYKRSDEAKLIYEQFLTKYPDHEMAQSAEFLLDNIGKSDQEILKQLEDQSVNQQQ